MIDAVHVDSPFRLVYPVDDPVLAHAGTVPTRQLAPKGMAHSVRIGNQATEQNSTMAPTTRGDVFARRSSCRVAGGDQRSP